MKTQHLIPFYKTRFAPTPSGYLHIGNILSFGITAALAKKYGAKILLRIDDLDKARANPLYIQDIFDTLNFLGIAWDEGPRNAEEFETNWSQLHRIDLYNQAIDQLNEHGKLFFCSCSRVKYAKGGCDCARNITSQKMKYDIWRIFLDKCHVRVRDYSGCITDAELSSEMKNFIIRKKDGYPSYQLASVVDDLHYGIDLIVRGEDLWPSTVAQLCLAEKLGLTQFGEITFYHHPLVKDISGEKLSKSAGATSIKYLRENGRSPAEILSAILNYIGLNERVDNWNEFIDIIYRKYIV